MDLDVVFYNAEDYVRTARCNLIHRKASVHGAQNVSIKGNGIVMSGCTVRGDLSYIEIGTYCLVRENTILKPGSKMESSSPEVEPISKFTPMLIGNHTTIGRDCVIEAASIGSNVFIDDGCVLGANCIIKDNCRIESNTVIPSGVVIPPFMKVRGKPGIITAELPSSFGRTQKEYAISFFHNFKKL